MVFRPDRTRARHDPYLDWKVGIFSAGAVLAMAGIYLGERWMTGAAIVVLLAGLLLRFAPSEEVVDDGGRETDAGEDPVARAGGDAAGRDGAPDPEPGADREEASGGS